ncbi:YbaN family protein [Lachnospiraceae bacterium NSJ-143]|mgnify:CR=1 FL=1|nr:YbaN family protein [Lachnospiraceae bacterium NSJ-143]
MKIIYMVLGTIFLILGLIGLALPVVPQVPFLLTAVYFLSKGSPRFEKWIKETGLYKKYLSKISMKLEINHRLKMLLTFAAVTIVSAAVVTAVVAIVK